MTYQQVLVRRNTAWWRALRMPPVHPFLIAMFPALALFATKPGAIGWYELVCTLGALMAVAAVTLVGLKQLYSTWNRAGLATSWTLALVFSFGFMHRLNALLEFARIPVHLNFGVLLALWAVLLVAGLAVIQQPRNDEDSLARLANLFGAGVAGVPLAMLLVTLVQHPYLVEEKPVTMPPVDVKLADPKQAPDIYYLVLDDYGDLGTLHSHFGYDNRAFLRQLQLRGFHIPLASRANYPQTDAGAAATLNMQYHPEQIVPHTAYRRQISGHQVGSLLKSRGYQTYHFTGLVENVGNDPRAVLNQNVSVMPTPFSSELFRFTAFYPWLPDTSPREVTLQKFDLLQHAAKTDGRKFVYAHFSAPGKPWRFDRAGQPPKPGQQIPARQAYLHQLTYMNQRLLETIDLIRAQTHRPAAIVLQSSRGPEWRFEGPASQIDHMRRETGVMTAVYLPGRNAAEVTPASISGVNVFRLILNQYFDAELPLLADRTHYWDRVNENGSPDAIATRKFIDITHQLTQQPDLATK